MLDSVHMPERGMERAEPAFKQPAVGAPAWRRSVCGKGQPSCGGQQLPLLSLAAGAWWVKMRESREGLGGEQAGGAGLCLRAAAAVLVGVAEQRQCCLLRGQPPAAVGAAKQGGEGGQQPQRRGRAAATDHRRRFCGTPALQKRCKRPVRCGASEALPAAVVGMEALGAGPLFNRFFGVFSYDVQWQQHTH